MKKIIASVLAASLMLLGTQVNAQVVPGAGYLRTTETVSNSSNATAYNGFYVGASFNIPIVGVLGIAPGFYANMLFANENNAGGSSILNATSSFHHTEIALNVPVNLTLKFKVGDSAAIFAYGGADFQYSVYSRSTYSVTASVVGFNLSDNGAYDHLDAKQGNQNPFNIFVGGGAGFQIGDLQLVVGYDYGLMDCDRSDNTKTTRSQLKVGLNFSL